MVPHGEVSELVHVSVPAETSALRNEPTDWRYTRSGRYTRSVLCSARRSTPGAGAWCSGMCPSQGLTTAFRLYVMTGTIVSVATLRLNEANNKRNCGLPLRYG